MALQQTVLEDIVHRHKVLDGKGQLLSQNQLAGYYATFRQRFGLEELTNLDGEALLEKMHGRNKGSLAYWLEFKNDEEFPARFGSIAGGSALKFGIYFRGETQTWRTGTPANQKDISLEEGIEYARNQRDQLVRGAELLLDLPHNGTDENYRALQESMDKWAPGVSNSAWGHKYFSLLYPDKLDDYHNAYYQRYHLIKLLQMPPKGDGRYVAAGRYLAIADDLDIPVQNLTEILNERDGELHHYWRIGTSDGEKPRNRWALMRDGGFAAIGWPELGDLTIHASGQGTSGPIKQLMAEKYYGSNPPLAGRKGQEVHNFLRAISERDLVLACDGATVLGVGRVLGAYEFDPSSDFPHRRPVEWLAAEEWDLPHKEGLRTTVYRMGKYPENLVETEKTILGASSAPLPQVEKKPLGSVPGRVQTVLERKRQIILYGPPGTGKTYWAEIAARELAARRNFGVPYGQLTPDWKDLVNGTAGAASSFVRMCTFHPAYGYEDFLEGYRPELVGGQLAFQPRDGIFKKLCDDARDHPQNSYYLIIDEINRGDIPRIFGELLTVLEKDKRGRPVTLPLTGKQFRVPDNVYVIGTMNTADRSIALLDTALRRRFGFVELMPDSSVLGAAVVGGVPLGPWLNSLNRGIVGHIGQDARNLQLGHSYLMDGGRPIADFATLIRVLQEDIIPLLEEYCYEDYSILEKILGNGLVDADNQRIRSELLDLSKKDELTHALLAPYPELITSPQVIASDLDLPGDEEAEGSDVVDEP